MLGITNLMCVAASKARLRKAKNQFPFPETPLMPAAAQTSELCSPSFRSRQTLRGTAAVLCACGLSLSVFGAPQASAQGAVQPGEMMPLTPDPSQPPRGPQVAEQQGEQQDAASAQSAQPAQPTISLDFDQAVQFGTLFELASQYLGVNIIADTAIMNQTVMFRAPVNITPEELMPLLATLVDQKNFALIKHPLGHYNVIQANNIPAIPSDGPGATTRVLVTPLIKPSQLIAPLREQLGQQQSRARMTALDSAGVLFVTGPTPTLDIVERLVHSIAAKLESHRVFRFPLANVSADFALERILRLHGELGSAGGATGARQPGQAAAAAGGAAFSSLGSRIVVDIDNQLIFRGTPEEAEYLTGLIDIADRVSGLKADQYVVGSVLDQVLSAAQRLGLGTSGTSSSFGPRPGAQSAQQTGSAGGSGFEVNEDDGSFIYYGTPAQHEQVKELVERFQKFTVDEEIVIRTYKLRYASVTADEDEGASGIVDILNELISGVDEDTASTPFLPGSNQQLAPGGQPSAEQQALQLLQDAALGEQGLTNLAAANSDNTTIVADSQRNQIIIQAPKAVQSQFARLIEELDTRRPQVQIQVDIVTINVTDGFDWNIDFGLNINTNSGSLQLFGGEQRTNGPGSANDFDFPSGGTNGGGLGVGLLNTSLFRFGLNTAESNGKARVLSSPMILVNDNETGSILNQRTEPFAETRFEDGAQVRSQGGTAEAGTTLTVTPQIGEGGDLILEYELELSSFDGEGGEGLQPPTNSNNYSSIVTLPSDTTLVVGGLEVIQESTSEDGVPILKDIPLLGAAMKDTSSSQSRQRIYVFITPRVLDDPTFRDLDMLSEGARDHADIPGTWPEFQPAIIPITKYVPLDHRLLPVNRAAAFSAADGFGTDSQPAANTTGGAR